MSIRVEKAETAVRGVRHQRHQTKASQRLKKSCSCSAGLRELPSGEVGRAVFEASFELYNDQVVTVHPITLACVHAHAGI